MEQEEILQELEGLTSNYNFIELIAEFIFRDFCGSIDDLYKRDIYNHFSANEAAFLIGLWVKNAKQSTLRNINYSSDLMRLYDLMNELHSTYYPAEGFIEFNNGLPISEYMTQPSFFKEAFFYSSTGAYDYQYVKMAVKKYKNDDKWLINTKGFSINKIDSFFKRIKQLSLNKLNNPLFRSKKFVSSHDLIDLFCLTHSELTNEDREFENILSCFKIKIGQNQQLKDISDYNEYQSRPIIEIEENRYFIPITYCLSEAIYESPFYWINNDKTYISTGLKNRGHAAEEITFKILSEVFHKNDVFKEVIIRKNRTKYITDIDLICFYKDSVVLFQVKSKKLTSLSKKGNIDSIEKDFTKAVIEAYKQGLKSKNCIENYADYDFIVSDNINIKHRFKSIKNIYIICTTLDFYPALSFSTQFMLYEKYDEPAICLSVFDLETICNYLYKPKTLIDYLEKRIKYCKNYYSETELNYLGFYLKKGLKPLKDNERILIGSDYGSVIDRSYYPALSKSSNMPLKKTVEEAHSKVGRNEKCPCGSGKKYKHCHGPLEQRK